MGSKGEIRINQAKRGYDLADDDQGQIMWLNPSVTFLPVNQPCFLC
jgi:hypothetical protein